MNERKAASAFSEGEMARTSEQDFRILFTTHPTPMWVYDPETLHFVVMNEAAHALYGYDAGKLSGMTVLDIRPPDERERMLAAVRDGSDLEKPERWRHLNAGGEIIEVLTYGRRVMFDGKPAILAIVQDMTERLEIERRMAHIAMHDSLTGLPNRASFARRIAELLQKGADAEPFALFYLDIDHFKHINDSIGHRVGDLLLQEVARRLRQVTTDDQFIARLGGDEFAVVHRSGTVAQVAQVAMFADRILSVFQEPFEFGGVSEFVTCSMGIAQAPLHGASSDALLRNADLALYASKSDGRRTFRFYQPALRLAAEKRHAMVAELRQALREGQFELHYQPIFNLESGRISCFEALIRWRHPRRGMIAPSEFIPIAEETGLIVEVGDWVLREACREAASWPDEIRVSVNLSPVQFSQNVLLSSVTDALEAARLSPERLELEITESVFLLNSKHNIELLFDLRRLGVRIAMDDFGTGYSSLSYLRSFPFDKIKIDRSFVSGIGEDIRDLAIIQAVATLGAGFNIVTTAEGVETAQQLERLRNEKFGEVQGFLTGRPMPAGDVKAFIQNREGAALDMPPARNTLPV